MTDREFFDNWAKSNIENYCDAIFDGKYYVMRENSRLTREKKNFLILSLNMGLRSWQASANREGFKLVPVEITDKIENAIHCAMINGGTARKIYKEIIGAIE
jgi:hypothetical protein